MPDWQLILRQRLGRLRLSPQGEADVLDELGAHFEQLYEAAITTGASPQQAIEQAAAQVPDWKRFRRDLERGKEDPVNQRTRTILIPGLTAMVAANILYAALLNWAGLRPYSVWPNQVYMISLFPYWIGALPLFGGAAAWWSRRAGGRLSHRLLAALAPVWVMAGLFSLGLLWGLIIERHVPTLTMLYSFAGYTAGWVVIPAIALLLGALPFLGSSPARSHPAAAQG